MKVCVWENQVLSITDKITKITGLNYSHPSGDTAIYCHSLSLDAFAGEFNVISLQLYSMFLTLL